MRDLTVNHHWLQQEQGALKGYWICEHCNKTSRTRRKPRDQGCLGPTYDPDELRQWTWETERKPNGGLSLYLVDPQGERKTIHHFAPGFIGLALWLEQYIEATRSTQ